MTHRKTKSELYRYQQTNRGVMHLYLNYLLAVVYSDSGGGGIW